MPLYAGRGLTKTEVERAEKAEIRTAESLAVGEACNATFKLTSGFRRMNLS